MPRLAPLVTLAALLFAASAHGAERWRRPLDGEVVGRFAYDREAAFASGRRRGIDVAARPGTVVRAACAGTVTFAGRLPGGERRGVTVRCGALAATHLGLVGLRVRRGAAVRAGAPLGVLDARGVLRLGARRRDDRFGYVDPGRLLAAGGPAPPAPLGRAPRTRTPPAPPPVAPLPAVVPRPAAAPGPRERATPPVVWLGLALLTGGLLGAAGGRARRARPAGAATRPEAAGARR